MAEQQKLRLALPSGSLQEATLKLMDDAGISLPPPSRALSIECDEPPLSIQLLRAPEIGKYVERQKFDAGITGYDWIVDSRSRVLELADMSYSKRTEGGTKWVVAVPADGPFKTLQDLEGKTVATEAVNLTKAFFWRNGINVNVEASLGATESKAPRLADAIVEVTETGSSLRANGLRMLADIMPSTPRFIANEKSYENPSTREQIQSLALALRSVLFARRKEKLEMNVPIEKAAAIVQMLDSLSAPDIVQTSNPKIQKITTIINKEDNPRLLNRLRELGATGIISTRLERVTPDVQLLPRLISSDALLGGMGERPPTTTTLSPNFDKGDGLVPCIIQDGSTKEVRMLGYMSKAALDATLETGKVTFFSRSRNELWTKGEKSGNFLLVQSVKADCDNDTLLIQVSAIGPTCHNGTDSCFDDKD